MRTTTNLTLIILLGAIAALTPLAIDMYLPAMPSIASDLNVSSSAVQITLTVYTASFAIGQVFFGPLADAYGRRPVLICGIALFALMSVLCALSQNIQQLTWIRGLQGFTGAAASVVIMALVRDMFERDDFARTMSFITLVMTVAPLIAPLIGGYVSVYLGWPAIFYGLALFACVVNIAVVAKIPETLSEDNRQPLRIGQTLRNYVKLLMTPVSVGYIFCGAFSFAGMFTFLTAGPFVYIDYYGIDPQHFGYYFGLNVLCLIVFTTFNGRMVKKLGSHFMLRASLTLQLIAGFLMVAGQVLQLGLWGTVIPVMMFMGNITVVGSNTNACLLSGYPKMAGTASAISGTIRFGVGAIVGAIIAVIPDATPMPMALTMATCALVSAAFYWLVALKS
ncbi:Bcr/CflA family multidrug efflux MFS transporter [Thaumasiovibrio sp. DFM-14]|uniref:Bcr/CflA family multidrug efflux MFS transporter n=1 Tax=Thaumasiovibrio sp. DFM-14 TaxID=3384792 RepID=UPI0039A0D6C6